MLRESSSPEGGAPAERRHLFRLSRHRALSLRLVPDPRGAGAGEVLELRLLRCRDGEPARPMPLAFFLPAPLIGPVASAALDLGAQALQRASREGNRAAS